MKTYTAKKIGEVINGLEVTGILRNENGQPVYATTCQECGARGVPVKHEQFSSGAAKCISSMHGRQRHQPTTIQKVRAEVAEEQRRNEEERQRPVREAEAALNATTRKLFELEKAEIVAGRRDLGWELPSSVDGLNMTLDEVRVFNDREAKAFVDEHPEFHRSQHNRKAVLDYLYDQGVMIADKACFAQAVERLRHFGLLQEKPAEPELRNELLPVVEPQTEPSVAAEESLIGWDEATGRERAFSAREVDLMSSEQFRRIFRLCVTRDGDHRPKFNRSRYS